MAKKLLCVAIIVLALVCTLASCGHEHVFGEWTVTKDATCITEGVETRTCECGESETRPLTAKGHTDGEWITDKDATCTEDGNKHQICSVCEATIKTEAIAKLGHTNGEWITDKDATCTEDGSKHQICSVCEAIIKTESIAATGHTFGDWYISIEATCAADGTKERSCHCNHKETMGYASEHNLEFVTATQNDNEFSAMWHCAICNLMINKKLDPISATFSTGFSMSTAVTYNFYVSATGGYGTYTYNYFVVDKPSNSVLATLLDTDSSGINYTDYSNRGFMDNNLAVRVYILDGIGQVAYEIMLNDGSFGSDAATLIEPYRITAP